MKFLLDNYSAIAQSERIKPETVFQRFFEKNTHLLLRGVFDFAWSKPRLPLPERPGRSLVPDFVLRPTVGAQFGTKWEILDLKLPDDRLIISRDFHATTAAKLTRAIQQLRDYRDYFSRRDPLVRETLVRLFGYEPVQPRLAVLIGRAAKSDGIERVQVGALDVQVITYDEIVEFEQSRLLLQGPLSSLISEP